MARVIAIDWSGALVGSQQRIWIAEAVDGDLRLLENGRSRAQVMTWLGERRSQVDDAIVGVDFAFSYPHWFLDQHGCSEIGQLWDLVATFGEEWLATCPAPFWGRPGKRRGDESQLRACETGCGRGVDEMRIIAAEMVEARPDGVFLMTQSNAGLPRLVGDEFLYDGTPEVMVEWARDMRALGINVIGACCGSTPAHIAAMRDAVLAP